MASNSKLTREQKNDLKAFKARMHKNMAFGQCGGVTVFAEVTGNVTRFATSVASPDELKIRAKVGKWHAADRFGHGECVVMPTPVVGDPNTPKEIADYVASLLS